LPPAECRSNISDEPEATIVERVVDPNHGQANYCVLGTIASAEDVDVTNLPPMYTRIEHLLGELFGEPPVDEAQIEASFSYYGYRVTVNQGGIVTPRKLDSSAGNVS